MLCLPCLPWARGKSSSSEKGNMERGSGFSLAFPYPFLLCIWYHLGHPLGEIRKPRELAKQDVHTASGDRMVRWCVIRCQDKWCRCSTEGSVQEGTVQGLVSQGRLGGSRELGASGRGPAFIAQGSLPLAGF